MFDILAIIGRVLVAAAFGGLLVVLAIVFAQYAGYRWPRMAVPYHMARGAWYAARYPGGARAAANMLRDERAMFVKARIARVVAIDRDALEATLARGRALVARRRG